MSYCFNSEFEKMMSSHQLTKVCIVGHLNPDGDAAGSVMGLAHYIKAVYPQFDVYPYLETALDIGPKNVVLSDPMFDPFHLPAFLENVCFEDESSAIPRYAAIACDTATAKRVVGYDIFKNAVVNISYDHHAGHEDYAETNITIISEACAANVHDMIDWEPWKDSTDSAIHPNAADYLYMGILTDTDCFSRANPNIMSAALHLQELGVNHFQAEKVMHTETFNDLMKKTQILSLASRIMEDKVAYIVVDKAMQESMNIDYEAVHPIAGILRNCADIELGITMFQAPENKWWCSFRSNPEWIDINHLLSFFGGGGHKAAAGLTLYDITPEEILPEIFKKIEELHA